MIRGIVRDSKLLSMTCRESYDSDTLSGNESNVIYDLMDTANSAKHFCAGLAANQIGHELRIFVMKIKNQFVPMVNPEIVSKSKGFRIEKEGCLSFPGYEARKKRHQVIKVSYTDPIKGKFIKAKKLKNMEARIFQHELDHLNGISIKTTKGER